MLGLEVLNWMPIYVPLYTALPLKTVAMQCFPSGPGGTGYVKETNGGCLGGLVG